MKVEFSVKRLVCILLVWTWLLGSYPANWCMMRYEWGAYNNDPNHTWSAGVDFDLQQGPSAPLRVCSLVFSPATTPANLVWELVKKTY